MPKIPRRLGKFSGASPLEALRDHQFRGYCELSSRMSIAAVVVLAPTSGTPMPFARRDHHAARPDSMLSGRVSYIDPQVTSRAGRASM